MLGQRRDRELPGHLKLECIHRRSWATRAAARTATYDYIEVFYNRQRRHSAIGYRTPAQHEALWAPDTVRAA